jgi:hypothetical protein
MSGDIPHKPRSKSPCRKNFISDVKLHYYKLLDLNLTPKSSLIVHRLGRKNGSDGEVQLLIGAADSNTAHPNIGYNLQIQHNRFAMANRGLADYIKP